MVSLWEAQAAVELAVVVDHRLRVLEVGSATATTYLSPLAKICRPRLRSGLAAAGSCMRTAWTARGRSVEKGRKHSAAVVATRFVPPYY